MRETHDILVPFLGMPILMGGAVESTSTKAVVSLSLRACHKQGQKYYPFHFRIVKMNPLYSDLTWNRTLYLENENGPRRTRLEVSISFSQIQDPEHF